MSNIFLQVLHTFIFVFIGYALKKTGLITSRIEKKISLLSFNVLLRILLVTNILHFKFSHIFNLYLMISFFGSGVLVFTLSFFIFKYLYDLKGDECTIFGFSSCYGNLIAIGIPLLNSILGSENTVPFMVLALFQAIIHITYTEVIIQHFRPQNKNAENKLINIAHGLFYNIVLLSIIVGIFLNYIGVELPSNLEFIVKLITYFALPAILITMGIIIASLKISYQLPKISILMIMKNIVHPIITFIVAKYIFQLTGQFIFIATLAAALPSGIQTYYISYRYSLLKEIIATNVVFSTFLSFFTLSLLLFFFGY